MWRVYYDDDSTFDSVLGNPEHAPSLGVICIVQPDPEVGRHVLNGFDFYWWNNGEWFGGEQFGLYDYLIRPGLKCVLFGRTVSNTKFREICKRAVEDPDFQIKSAWYQGEHK